MTWLQTVPALLAAALIIFVPGAVLARCLGVRGIAWLGLAAPLSISLVGVGAMAAQLIHVRWSLPVVALVTILGSAVAWGLRYLLIIRRSPAPRGPLWVRPRPAVAAGLVAGVVLGAGLIGARFAQIFMRPENLSQTYDNVFHLNAVRFILDTGNGSSLFLGNLEGGGTRSFYPGVWHDVVALVVQTADVPIPVGVNCVNIVLGALVWTVSAMYLATRALGARPAVFLMTGALAGAFAAFPYLLMDFGVLYPNFLAVTLLPAFIALVADVLALSTRSHPGTILGLVLLVLAAPGLALSHPSVVIVLGAFALPLAAFWLYRQTKARLAGTVAWPPFITSVLAFVGYLLLLDLVWTRVRPTEKASFWPPTQTVAQALGQAIANAPQGLPTSLVILGLTVLGTYAVVQTRRHLWLLGAFAVSVFLFIAATGFGQGPQRSFFTGVFYNDSFRLAAMLPVVALPLAVYGTVWLFDVIVARLPQVSPGRNRQWIAVATAGTLACLAIATAGQDSSVAAMVARAQLQYAASPTANLLSTDERALILRADRKIPANATVIVNPLTGAALVYALADRKVILPAAGSTPSPDDRILTHHLTELGSDAAVCAAVKRLDSYYLLDFGARQINKMNMEFPSSQALAATPGLTLLDREGPAKLYRIDACP
ncbi:DUF6541 family protein [Specibacter sp. RAF43]|uniref:DUF6541 family protein n=1 Tax=Specibacter sp. RAF43 TaxID=3233057 RepID=UPI003F98C3A5